MAAEHGPSSRSSSKRRQSGDGSGSPWPMRGLSPAGGCGPAAMEDSPKRFSVDGSRIEAPSLSAPTYVMSIAELSQAYQHLAAQAALDKQWAGRVEGTITDHAQLIDRHSSAGNEVATCLNSMVAAFSDLAHRKTTTDTTGATTGATAPALGAADAALRAHVQAQDAAMGASLQRRTYARPSRVSMLVFALMLRRPWHRRSWQCRTSVRRCTYQRQHAASRLAHLPHHRALSHLRRAQPLRG